MWRLSAARGDDCFSSLGLVGCSGAPSWLMQHHLLGDGRPLRSARSRLRVVLLPRTGQGEAGTAARVPAQGGLPYPREARRRRLPCAAHGRRAGRDQCALAPTGKGARHAGATLTRARSPHTRALTSHAHLCDERRVHPCSTAHITLTQVHSFVGPAAPDPTLPLPKMPSQSAVIGRSITLTLPYP
jgi:hypothetical protein